MDKGGNEMDYAYETENSEVYKESPSKEMR